MLWLVPLGGAAQEASSAILMDFSSAAPGMLPTAWSVGPSPAYAAEIVEAGIHPGHRAMHLRSVGARGARESGMVSQRVAAAPYRGKRLRYSAWVRTDSLSEGSGGGLWLRVERPDGVIGFVEAMADRLITASEWQRYEITIGEVEQDAEWISFGLRLYGAGQTWIDRVSLEVLGATAASAAEPPRLLMEHGAENLVAFARLLGYLRYFHPSDAAASADWDSLAVAGVRAVESAPSAETLAGALVELFAPVAPTVQMFLAGEAREPSPAPRAGGEGVLQTVHWVHRGVGSTDPRSVYRSERVRRALSESASGNVPTSPVQRRLGAGLSAWIPTVLYADSVGTLPRTELDYRSVATRSLPPSTRYTAADRSTRLANVVLAWNVFQHFYPYFDEVEVDWPAELMRALHAAAMDADECEHLRTLRRIVATLNDGHGQVSHRCNWGDRTPPVGLAWVEEHPTVLFVEPGTERVRPGDRLLQVDGRDASEVLRERMAIVSAATPQYRYYSALQELLGGPVNSEVVLTLEHLAGDTAVVRLRRTANPWQLRERERRPAPVAELRPGIWYVDPHRLSTEEWEATVPQLRNASGIVFDLRRHAYVDVHRFFAPLIRRPVTSGQFLVPVVTRPDREHLEFTGSDWSIRPQAPYLSAPKVFLTSARAISYAETLLGIVEQYRLGEIIGEATAGTNGNINTFTLPGGYSVVWTGMKALKQDGSPHHRVGIRPTHPVHRTRAGVAAGMDEVLEQALEVLSGASKP